MTAKDVMTLLNPSALVYFESELLTHDGREIVGAGQLAAIKLQHQDWAGHEITIWASPVGDPTGVATAGEIAERIRIASADEERSWLSRAEGRTG